MDYFILDASALVKRYYPETGAVLVDDLFARVSRDRLMCLMLGAAEVAATLARKRNGGLLTPSLYTMAVTNLRLEVILAANFTKLPAYNPLIEAAIPLLDQHAINSNDAILLRSALNLAAQLLATGNGLVIVASDRRLLNAAHAEGLLTFNPETQTQAELDTLLGP